MGLAVIGILVVLLLPALALSKAVSKRIHCAGNIRQLALVEHLYVDDIEDRLFRNVYLYGGTNVFQCAGNRLPQGGSEDLILLMVGISMG